MVLVNAQSNQVFAFPLGLLPVVPDAVSKSVSEPFIHSFQLCVDTGKAVIVYPSPPNFRQLLQPFFETVRSGFLGDLLELPLE